MILHPTHCSRCGSTESNPGCYVCGEHPSDCGCHDCQADREAMHGDWLRDELRDREMEEKSNQ